MDPNTPEPQTTAPDTNQATSDTSPHTDVAQPKTEDTSTSMPAPVEPTSKGGKKKLFVILATVLVFLLGGVAAAYYMVLVPNKPENKVKTALYDLVDADQMEITANLKAADTSVTVTGDFNLQASAAEVSLSFGADGFVIKAVARAVDGKTYISLEDASGLSSLATSFLGESISLDGLEGNWYQIDLDQAGSLLGENTSKCDVSTLLTSDQAQADREAFKNAYDKNPLFVVTADGKGDVNGTEYPKYKLEPADDATAEAFLNDIVANMPVVKALSDCTGQELDTNSLTNQDGSDDSSLYFYLDGSKLKRVEIADNKGTDTLTLDIDLDKQVNIDAPSNAKPFSELYIDLMSGFGLDDYQIPDISDFDM
ncbi:hypothetical protein KDA23_04770 [Candidatus Saccharibacteria bacterium]|nr:hypothetical protein [Candidatus Saccharibacteria bacterium]MCB9821580.1 hypothetical protein [Candidatus Nomurabacteria bacterium]